MIARAAMAPPMLAAVRAQLDAGKSLEAIFGELDAMKFRSSVEIFEL